MFVGALLSHLGPILMLLGRVGVAWRLGEVPGMTDEPSGLIRTRELFTNLTPQNPKYFSKMSPVWEI